MVINVEVSCLGIFQQLYGNKLVKMKLDEPATVRTLIKKLTANSSSEFKQALLDSELDNPHPNSLILVGGKEISALQGLETEIKDAEKVVLVPVAHGG